MNIFINCFALALPFVVSAAIIIKALINYIKQKKLEEQLKAYIEEFSAKCDSYLE